MDRIKKFLFHNENTRQILVKNTFWFALGTAVTKIARALIVIYVAKILGAGQYGIFTYALSLVGIFMIFADMGITGILTRELSKDSDEKSNYLSTTFVIKIGFLAFSVLTAAIFGPLISKFPESSPLIVIIAIFVATESLRGFLYSVTRAQNKMQIEAGLSVGAELISIVVILLLFLKDKSVTALADAFVIGNLIGLVVTIFFLRKNFSGIIANFKKSLIWPIVSASWPFAVMGVFSVFMTNIDSVMIGFWNTPEVLGVYAAAQKPISLLYVVPGFLSVSLFPFISRLVANAKENIGDVISKSSRISLGIGLPIIFGGILLAGPILTVAFGDEYAGAVLTFQILLLTLLPAFPGAVFNDVILAENGQKIFIRSTALGALTNVALNFILIPRYGIAGSAVATVAAQCVMNGILYAKIRNSYAGIKVWGVWKLFFASAAMLPIIYVLKNWSVPLLIIVPVSALVYIGMLFALKEPLVADFKAAFRL